MDETDFYDDGSCTIIEYLQGFLPDKDMLPDKALRTILVKRGLDGNADAYSLPERERDLAEAEVYYQLSNLPVGGSTTKDVDGTWSHSEGGWTVSSANNAEWWRKYTTLREKWNEAVVGKGGIRVHARGMRVWHKTR